MYKVIVSGNNIDTVSALKVLRTLVDLPLSKVIQMAKAISSLERFTLVSGVDEVYAQQLALELNNVQVDAKIEPCDTGERVVRIPLAQYRKKWRLFGLLK
ncbi:conserved hypothetical protein [Alteromonas sp. 38]|uniref:hypothetical protein n=1 Tax=Alteromonas TaxID=226 RepID=UPI0012F0F42D|nr:MULTISPECIES: hypothetical protein [Alteromonas]CAD5264926.1 conserved hypothetical protein [Alteromonas sp. 154]VXC13488.1 conserved hypothetical protein [Alteromonas sp. 38]